MTNKPRLRLVKEGPRDLLHVDGDKQLVLRERRPRPCVHHGHVLALARRRAVRRLLARRGQLGKDEEVVEDKDLVRLLVGVVRPPDHHARRELLHKAPLRDHQRAREADEPVLDLEHRVRVVRGLFGLVYVVCLRQQRLHRLLQRLVVGCVFCGPLLELFEEEDVARNALDWSNEQPLQRCVEVLGLCGVGLHAEEAPDLGRQLLALRDGPRLLQLPRRAHSLGCEESCTALGLVPPHRNHLCDLVGELRHRLQQRRQRASRHLDEPAHLLGLDGRGPCLAREERHLTEKPPSAHVRHSVGHPCDVDADGTGDYNVHGLVLLLDPLLDDGVSLLVRQQVAALAQDRQRLLGQDAEDGGVSQALEDDEIVVIPLHQLVVFVSEVFCDLGKLRFIRKAPV
mmetsp:Transcript_5792/g.11122  ORF Transcript_5792/g.11122 Transcript_5792/m.11122 type:complete len:398 (-) Transcript_5792:334-1527(-)